MPDEMNDQKVSRRDALKMAGAAAIAAPAIQKVRAANDQVSFGLIGTGSRGSYLLKHLKSIDIGRCTAVCDINEAALQHGYDTIGTNPAKFKDYRELLSRKDVDAVIIAVPLFKHFDVTRDALSAGKHTFCEKSLVFKPEEIHALRALAAEHSHQVLQVGLQRRYSVFYQTVKEMIDKGVLGNVTHMQAQWHRNPGWKMKPNPDMEAQKMANWRLYREYSGGMAAELASHQIDVADWMFGSSPEYVIGVGGHDYIFDGRDINDNIQLIFKYPKAQKLMCSYISTNSHLAQFNSTRTEFGEVIMGTEGSVEITIGDDSHPALAVWFREPAPPAEVTKASGGEKKWQAGATMVAAGAQKGFPIMMYRDEVGANDSFLDREMKYGRRWLYSKGIATPEEPRNPVDIELESFFTNCRDGKRPKADVEVGLADSTSVILSNLAVDEQRRVYFSEIEKMGRGEKPAETKPKRAENEPESLETVAG
jgi:predicted dehydrogenase